LSDGDIGSRGYPNSTSESVETHYIVGQDTTTASTADDWNGISCRSSDEEDRIGYVDSQFACGESWGNHTCGYAVFRLDYLVVSHCSIYLVG
jgi:hypothetical protein